MIANLKMSQQCAAFLMLLATQSFTNDRTSITFTNAFSPLHSPIRNQITSQKPPSTTFLMGTKRKRARRKTVEETETEDVVTDAAASSVTTQPIGSDSFVEIKMRNVRDIVDALPLAPSMESKKAAADAMMQLQSSQTNTPKRKGAPDPETDNMKSASDGFVNMKMRDVRDIVNETPSSTTFASRAARAANPEVENLVTTERERTSSSTSSGTVSSGNDSMDRLLADAKRMRAENPKDEGGIDIVFGVKNIISTIITADFFLVCALLVWFVAGIFCSYVLKDDFVQIQFNNRFETIVQPALGILMIGSAAGAIFNNEDEEAGWKDI